MQEPRETAGYGAAEPVGADELRRRATGGAALLSARGALVLVLGVGAYVVLARLLEPRDFGLVALGASLLIFGGYLADSGLGSALIRRDEPPSRRELEAVNGVQLGVAAALALAVAGCALPFGRDGLVVAAMAATLPVTVLRAPSIIVLQRRLSYRAVATVDVLEAVVFYAWAITAVALGMGVWGMVTGMAVRALVGTAAMARLGPVGLVRPRWSWADVRPLVAFGAKLQAVAIVGIVRDQGLNIAIAAVAGIATLGVWNLAFRVLQVPTVVFSAVGRIAYPMMSRLLATGRDPRSAIERSVATVTVVTGFVVVAIAGFAPALPTLVGDAWGDVPATLAWSCVAILLNAPVYLATVGYLYAADQVGAVFRVMVAYAVLWFAVAVPLLPALGAPAVGVGWLAASAVSAVLLARQAGRRTGARIAANHLPPACVALAAGGAGWAIATAGGETALDGVLGAAAAELLLLGGLAVVRRPLLRDTYRLLSESLRPARAAA